MFVSKHFHVVDSLCFFEVPVILMLGFMLGGSLILRHRLETTASRDTTFEMVEVRSTPFRNVVNSCSRRLGQGRNVQSLAFKM